VPPVLVAARSQPPAAVLLVVAQGLRLEARLPMLQAERRGSHLVASRWQGVPLRSLPATAHTARQNRVTRAVR
jgi:hypothetical protein